MTVVDLKKLAGEKYRVTIESSYYAETGSSCRRNSEKQWGITHEAQISDFV